MRWGIKGACGYPPTSPSPSHSRCGPPPSPPLGAERAFFELAMYAAYIARRFGVFLLIIWLAATLNFLLPRLSGQDPVRTKLLQQAALGGYVQSGIDEMTREYERRFGLDKPLWRQYVTYLEGVSRLDFNYSIANYPRTVRELIGDAVPWTVGLLGTTTLFSFALGTLLGALLAWPQAPRWMAWLMPPLWALHAIPFFLLGLILTYVLAFQVPLLPIFGGYSPGAVPALSWKFAADVIRHALLPALSIILVSTGGWALGMRGMMVTTMGEDYVVFAEAKGLKAPTVFLNYCLRNAILPQVTALALALGQILSGAVLVEVIFGYPGIGTLLYQAIRENDYFVIQGIVFTVIVALGFTTLVLDLIYPMIDPRISYRQA
jgi:peptide/nickel transport system permease protein